MNKTTIFSFLPNSHISSFSPAVYSSQRTPRGLFKVAGCFLKQFIGMCSTRISAKNISAPYHKPTTVVYCNMYSDYSRLTCVCVFSVNELESFELCG